ncbi:MAG: MFS transporter [Hyphomicrobium sp.]|uniref:MFS transporter n=1 Tax=Hyphomicrobium sp. TaxID=82 RepID=UPI003D12F3A9
MGREPGRGGWRTRTLAPDARASYGLRLATFYGALFAVYGVHLPYLPVWLDVRGLTAEQIAAITAAPYFLRVLITPAVALWADASGRHRALINGLAWLALLLAVLFTRMQTFWPIFLLAVPFAIALSSIVPLTETLAVAGARAHALDYGRMRLWGSITFVAAGFIGGWLIDHVGTGAVTGCILASMVATVACAWALPERAGGNSSRRRAEGEPAAVPGAEGFTTPAVLQSPSPDSRARNASNLEEARKLVASPLFLAFLVAAGCAQAAHGMFYAFGALHWHAQGISTAWVGVLWAIAIVGEVALFAYSDYAVRRWGPTTLLVAATAASAARWVLMSVSPPLLALFPLQTLHTLTYGASHLGAMHFIARAVPEGAQGTAQALYATVASGVLMGAATLSSGWLYARIGVQAYLAMAALAAVGFAAALIVRARWTGGLLWDDAKSA